MVALFKPFKKNFIPIYQQLESIQIPIYINENCPASMSLIPVDEADDTTFSTHLQN